MLPIFSICSNCAYRSFRGGKITCVIASKADAYALTRAADNGIKTRVLARRDFPDVKSYSKAMRDALVEENADLVVYAGFMTILDEKLSRSAMDITSLRNIRNQ